MPDTLRIAQSSRFDVTLAVLAGGEGRRMGVPKARLRVGGRPILEHLLDEFAWPGPTLLVTAPGREHPPGWQEYGREVSDPVAGGGPLRGILTALEAAATRYVVVTPVDMPLVRGDHLRWLADELRHRPGMTAALLSRTNEDGVSEVEPLPSAFDVAAAGAVRGLLDAGRGAVHGLGAESTTAVVPAPAEWGNEVWLNLNTPEDLADFLAARAGRRSGSR